MPTIPAPRAASRRRKSRKLWFILAGVVVLAVLFAAGLSRRNRDKGIPVTTAKAFIKDVTQVVTATGKVQPETEVKISPEVAGEIIAMPVQEGDRVRKGQLLVKIKPDFYEAQLAQQDASLAAAKAASALSRAQLNKATQDLRQAKDLHDKSLISDADMLAAQTAAQVAQADFVSSEAQIKRAEGLVSQAQDQLSKTVIYSPMDGTISSRSCEVGERVVGTGQFAGTEIMRVADLSSMEADVQVNESDIINVKVGDPASISIDAYPDRTFAGTVKEIAASAQGTADQSAAPAQNVTVANFLVKIRIKQDGASLKPGMSATADIRTQTVDHAVVVPIQSVTVRASGGKTVEELQQQRAKEAKEKTGSSENLAAGNNDAARRDREQLNRVVFVVDGAKVRLQKVTTGIADDTDIVITSGIKPGDVVVAGSYAAISRQLKDGSDIKIEKPAKTAD